MVLRRFFTKVFQAGQRTFASLYLVKYDERIVRVYGFAQFYRKLTYNAGRVKIPFKNGYDLGRILHIEISGIFVILLAKRQRRIGLPHLPCSAE